MVRWAAAFPLEAEPVSAAREAARRWELPAGDDLWYKLPLLAAGAWCFGLMVLLAILWWVYGNGDDND